jgi:hypothetical protein
MNGNLNCGNLYPSIKLNPKALLSGSLPDAIKIDLDGLDIWLEEEQKRKDISDIEHESYLFLQNKINNIMTMSDDYDLGYSREEISKLLRKEAMIVKRKKPGLKVKGRISRNSKESNGSGWQLPTGRRDQVDDPWRYAYLITGEKKIGKTSFAINGCEEYVIQLDKPQIGYKNREDCP